jgi:hypothetical protein
MRLDAENVCTAGVVIFGCGIVTRTYMNLVLDGWRFFIRFRLASTEKRYMQQMREEGAPAWPFIATVILLPLGAIVGFGGVLLF